MKKSNKKIVMVGAGGHAKVIYDITKIIGVKVSHIVDTKSKINKEFSSPEHIKSDDSVIKKLSQHETCLINALGIIPGRPGGGG